MASEGTGRAVPSLRLDKHHHADGLGYHTCLLLPCSKDLVAHPCLLCALQRIGVMVSGATLGSFDS